MNKQDAFEVLALRPGQQLEKGVVVVEGQKSIEKAIKTNQNILCILETDKYQGPQFEIENKVILKNSKLEKLAGFKFTQGIIAICKRPPLSSLEEFQGPILALNGLTSPENVGAIMRSAAGLNFNNIIYDTKGISPYLKRCIRVSMGNVFFQKIHASSDLLKTLNDLKSFGKEVLLLDSSEKSTPLVKTKSSNFILVVGKEGGGINPEILDAFPLEIKSLYMNPCIDNYNAAVAASLAMFKLSES